MCGAVAGLAIGVSSPVWLAFAAGLSLLVGIAAYEGSGDQGQVDGTLSSGGVLLGGDAVSVQQEVLEAAVQGSGPKVMKAIAEAETGLNDRWFYEREEERFGGPLGLSWVDSDMHTGGITKMGGMGSFD